MAKRKITDELITNVGLLRARIVSRNQQILNLYKRQLEDINDLQDIMSDYELENTLEEWYLDVVELMSKVGIEGSNDRFKTTWKILPYFPYTKTNIVNIGCLFSSLEWIICKPSQHHVIKIFIV